MANVFPRKSIRKLGFIGISTESEDGQFVIKTVLLKHSRKSDCDKEMEKVLKLEHACLLSQKAIIEGHTLKISTPKCQTNLRDFLTHRILDLASVQYISKQV